MVDRKHDLYRVQSETPGPAVGPQHESAPIGHRGVFGHGRGPITYYNYGVVGHYARDCQSPTTTCNYCKYYDHAIEECPILISKTREPKPTVHQNIQLIPTEQKELEPRVNIETRSGASTSLTS